MNGPLNKRGQLILLGLHWPRQEQELVAASRASKRSVGLRRIGKEGESREVVGLPPLLGILPGGDGWRPCVHSPHAITHTPRLPPHPNMDSRMFVVWEEMGKRNVGMGSGGYHMDDPSTGMYNPGLVCDRREAPYATLHCAGVYYGVGYTPSGKQRWCMVLVILGVYSLREAPYDIGRTVC